MTNRRNVFKKILAGAAAISAATLAIPGRTLASSNTQQEEECGCPQPAKGPYASYFTNVIVRTHHNQKALFYDDLLRGKVVMINCMSIESEPLFEATEKLLSVQELLGDRLGRDCFILSITTDPEKDTPQALNDFAKKMGIREGWTFISGNPGAIQLIRGRLFPHPSGYLQGGEQAPDCSMGLIRYGNEAVGLWGSVPTRANPEWIVKRLSWIESKSPVKQSPRRRGPVALIEGKPWLYNSGDYS